MKKQVLNEIENLVKKFNEKNLKFSNKAYIMKAEQFKRGHYVVKIEYRLFYSTDLMELMTIIKDNNLLMWLGVYSMENTPGYIEIQ